MSFEEKKYVIPGPKSKELIEQWHKYETPKLGFEAPVALEYGSGATLTDVDGQKFIDWTSGVIVTNVGHAHPTLVKAMQEATGRVLNLYEWCHPDRVKAAKALVEASPEQYDQCFFLSTGSEATDCASRVMKRYTGKYEIVSFYGGFHGRTLSTASMGGLKKQKLGMGPMMPGSIRVPFPYCYRCPFGSCPEKCNYMCIEFYDDVVRANSCGSLAGFIGEPYQGAGGYVFPPTGFWKNMEKWIREHDMMFTLDEVQASYGRTGTMWAQDREGIKPDITTLGKGIGGGAVVTALLLNSKFTDDCMVPGDMGSTYGGNPVSCAAVSAVLQIFEEEKIMDNVAKISPMLEAGLRGLMQKHSCIGDVRGSGMAWGVELVTDRQTKEPAADLARKVVLACAEKGLLIGIVGRFGNVLRVSPPLVMTEDQTAEALDILDRAFREVWK